jgi:hypothetical protein
MSVRLNQAPPGQSAAVAEAPASSISRIPTWHPSSANRIAVALPIPLAAPVSSARRPESPLIADPPGCVSGASGGPVFVDGAFVDGAFGRRSHAEPDKTLRMKIVPATGVS